jgi:acetyltransferase
VRSDVKGCGIGWQLMSHLIAYAKSEALQQLYGTVLADNATMLAMCRELGFRVEADPGDASVRTVRLRIN